MYSVAGVMLLDVHRVIFNDASKYESIYPVHMVVEPNATAEKMLRRDQMAGFGGVVRVRITCPYATSGF